MDCAGRMGLVIAFCAGVTFHSTPGLASDGFGPVVTDCFRNFCRGIAGALRVYSDSLRVKRQLQAQEMAAKASVKMTFPLVLFVFPATFIVLAGPTVVKMMQSPLFN